MSFSLSHWSDYLTEDVRNTIISFVNDCANGGAGERRILHFIGTGGNGKSTLVEEIKRFLGESAYTYSASETNLDRIKLYIIPELSETNNKSIMVNTNVLTCGNEDLKPGVPGEVIRFDHKF